MSAVNRTSNDPTPLLAQNMCTLTQRRSSGLEAEGEGCQQQAPDLWDC